MRLVFIVPVRRLLVALILLTCAGVVQIEPAQAEHVEPGGQSMGEQYTPVIQTVLAAPRWFKGADERFHLAYELLLTNAFPVPVTVTSVEVIDPAAGASVATLSGAALGEAISLLTGAPMPHGGLPSSTIAVVWFDLTFAQQSAIPPLVEHRVTVAVPPGLPVPASIAAVGGRAEVDLRPPVVIGPPLVGPRWVAVGSCCDGPHRRSIQAINGHLYLSQRFAIDFNLLDAAGRITFGDPAVNASTAGYGQPVIAVADAVVVTAVDRFPDQIIGDEYAVTIENADGNFVILDLGEGRYAFYAHLRPGTVAVKLGDRVTRGQLLGELGNSGSSSGAHLHFQLMDRPSALVADGLPYVFDSFVLTGRTPPLADVLPLYEQQLPIPINPAGAGPRLDALPLGGDEVAFVR